MALAKNQAQNKFMKVSSILWGIMVITVISLSFYPIANSLAVKLPECALSECNCSDFASQEEAQEVFELFKEDIFNLDKNKDGIVCSSLPSPSKTVRSSVPTKVVPPQASSSLALEQIRFGNPSQANYEDFNNYLIPKEQFVISYNCGNNLANWVSWTVNADYLGDVERTDDFRRDPDVPCYQVSPRDYRRSGYDRGHIAPSADRDSRLEDNSATFFMSNMMPQSPSNNREVWRELENYERDFIREMGSQAVYIVAGPLGNIGTIGNGVVVPKTTWKSILVLDSHGQPLETLAVNIPNDESIKNTDWRDYLLSVDELENLTGYDFFNQLPDNVENKLESIVYR